MKSTKAEVRQRVEEVFKLRLGGANFPDILQYASAPEQAWGVSERQIWNYIKAADQLLLERFDAKAPHLLNRHLLQRNQVYAHAMGAGDFRTALAILQDEAKLEGLYPPTKIAPTNPEGDKPYVGSLTDDERLAALERLYASLGARNGSASAHGPSGALGSLLAGSGAAPDGCRPDSGPVADGVAAESGTPDPAPLFPPGG
jgi:hypothetical protein